MPDVLLKLYIKGKKYEAPTQKRTTNPQWSNFTVQVDVDDVRSEKLIVKLVEERSFIHRDRVLGNASISLAELPVRLVHCCVCCLQSVCVRWVGVAPY